MHNKFANLCKVKKTIVHCHSQFNIDCDNIFLVFEGFKVS